MTAQSGYRRKHVARRPLGAALIAAILTAVLGGCAPSPAADDGTIRVVAASNVWGDIAAEIGGASVAVTNLISSETQDPHEFAASATNLVTVANANVIIINGGGYDEFASQLIDGSETDAIVIDVSTLTPRTEDNEHYWYDLDTASIVSQTLAHTFSGFNPGEATMFTARAETFQDAVDELHTSLSRSASGATVLMAEPLPGYLFRDFGYRDVTPTALSRAIEAGSEIPAVALNEALNTIRNRTVTVLALNAQDETAQTTQLASVARTAGIPVVTFSEVLPAGTSYLDWMRGNISQVVNASA